jgi:NAD(P)-dependent dehydrogenase (short-subunit alcohol dehydrogenase family)
VTIGTAGKEIGPAAHGLALVTGATGFLGGALTRRLLADGARVRVLARSAGRARALADLGAEVATGCITDQAAVRAAVDGAWRTGGGTGRLWTRRNR